MYNHKIDNYDFYLVRNGFNNDYRLRLLYANSNERAFYAALQHSDSENNPVQMNDDNICIIMYIVRIISVFYTLKLKHFCILLFRESYRMTEFTESHQRVRARL